MTITFLKISLGNPGWFSCNPEGSFSLSR